MSLLSISIREFETAEAWKKVADEERARCELLVVGMNQAKNEYITPYV